MKLTTVLMAILLLATVQLNAQSKSIGFKAGLSIPNIISPSNHVLSRDYKSIITFDAGFFYEYKFSNKFSLQPEINFSIKGGERNGRQPVISQTTQFKSLYTSLLSGGFIQTGDLLYADYDNKTILNYLEIPVLVKYYLDKKRKFFLEAGPGFGLLIKSQTKTSGSSNLYNRLGVAAPSVPAISLGATTDTKNDLHSVNVSALLGAGYALDLKNNNSFLFGARINYGLGRLQKDKNNGDSHTGGIVISVGYKIPIGKSNIASKEEVVE